MRFHRLSLGFRVSVWVCAGTQFRQNEMWIVDDNRDGENKRWLKMNDIGWWLMPWKFYHFCWDIFGAMTLTPYGWYCSLRQSVCSICAEEFAIDCWCGLEANNFDAVRWRRRRIASKWFRWIARVHLTWQSMRHQKCHRLAFPFNLRNQRNLAHFRSHVSVRLSLCVTLSLSTLSAKAPLLLLLLPSSPNIFISAFV